MVNHEQRIACRQQGHGLLERRLKWEDRARVLRILRQQAHAVHLSERGRQRRFVEGGKLQVQGGSELGLRLGANGERAAGKSTGTLALKCMERNPLPKTCAL